MASPLETLAPSTTLTSVETDITVVKNSSAGRGYGSYVAFFWIIWLFLAPLFVYWLFFSFPFPWLLTPCPYYSALVQPGAQVKCEVDKGRLFFFSWVVGWLLVLIFWAISRLC